MSTPGPWDYVDQAKATVQRIVDTAEEQARNSEAMNAQIQAIRIERWSPRREVRIVLGPDGFIVDLEFARSAPHTAPATLARALQQAHDAAMRELHERMDDLAAEHLGDEPAFRQWITSTTEQKLGRFADPDAAE